MPEHLVLRKNKYSPKRRLAQATLALSYYNDEEFALIPAGIGTLMSSILTPIIVFQDGIGTQSLYGLIPATILAISIRIMLGFRKTAISKTKRQVEKDDSFVKFQVNDSLFYRYNDNDDTRILMRKSYEMLKKVTKEQRKQILSAVNSMNQAEKDKNAAEQLIKTIRNSDNSAHEKAHAEKSYKVVLEGKQQAIKALETTLAIIDDPAAGITPEIAHAELETLAFKAASMAAMKELTE